MYYDNKRLALSVFWLLLGAVLTGLSAAEVIDGGIWSGMGGALIGVGAVRLLMILRYRKDPEYKEKVDTEAQDERNRFLRMKSWAWTGYVVLITEAVGSVAAMILKERIVQLALSYTVCFTLIVYLISYAILSKKY